MAKSGTEAEPDKEKQLRQKGNCQRRNMISSKARYVGEYKTEVDEDKQSGDSAC